MKLSELHPVWLRYFEFVEPSGEYHTRVIYHMRALGRSDAQGMQFDCPTCAGNGKVHTIPCWFSTSGLQIDVAPTPRYALHGKTFDDFSLLWDSGRLARIGVQTCGFGGTVYKGEVAV